MRSRQASGVVDTRSELLTLLTEACELEHALACAYLTAAFSLKQDIDEGLTFVEQQRARRWAAQLHFVASQEMLHLAQAWNLLTAIGGTPYFGRPDFPVEPDRFPLDLGLPLGPLSRDTLERFVRFEAPDARQRAAVQAARPHPDDTFRYRTVGELYGLIASGFASIPEPALFSREASQADRTLVHFPDIVVVHDRASAEHAIDRIRLQGEGTPSDDDDGHFGIFQALLGEWTALGEQAARVVRARDGFGEGAHRAAALFDKLYVWMLQLLGFGFAAGPATPAQRSLFAGTAIESMVRVLKPLGELLARHGVGPSFVVRRHVALPTTPAAAAVVAAERVIELAATGAHLSERLHDPWLGSMARLLREFGARLTAVAGR